MPEDQNVSDPDDIDLRGVRWGGAMVAFGIVFALVAAYFAFHALQPARGYGGPDAAAGMRIAPPVLETAPQPQRASYAAEKEQLIDGYGWVDRKAGIARIPVEQAMRVMAAQAASAMPAAPATPVTPAAPAAPATPMAPAGSAAGRTGP